MGRAAAIFWPRSLGHWRGVKRSSTIKLQFQSQFQRFLYQTLCVFSQIKDIKHIKQDFHSVAWVMLQMWDFGVKKLIFPNMDMVHIKLKGMMSRTEYKSGSN